MRILLIIILLERKINETINQTMKVSVFQVVVILLFGLVMVTGVFGKSISRVRDINREELETDTDVIRTFLFF